MPSAAEAEQARKFVPYLVGIATTIVDRGDLGSYPYLNQLSQGVLASETQSRAMFWQLLVAANRCLDQDKFDAWRARRPGEFFDVIYRLFGLMQGVAAGGPDANVYAEDIDEMIGAAGRTSEPWTTLTQLTVAVVEVTDRGRLEIWMHSPAT